MIRSFKYTTAPKVHVLKQKALIPNTILWMILSCILFVQAADTTKTKKNIPLILQSAESNENTYINNEFISYLKGNVTFLYDNITIRSDEATWWRSEGKIHFQDNVKITQKSQLLTCDKMDFTRRNNQIDAVGHFFYRDTAQLVELTGHKANYLIETKTFTLTGSPRLLRFDTTAAETLVIIGKTMNYIDSLKLATVTDDVVITKGKLTSHCQKAQYQTEKNIAYLRIKPHMTYDINELVGDSIDLQFGKETMESASIGGNAHAVYIDTTGKSNDTTFTHIWGDSLFVSVSDSGALDSLWVHEKAVSKYFTAQEKDIINQANGKTMLLAFGDDGNVDNVKIWGNARSTYYIEDDGSRGINEASGDSMTVAFRKGKFVFLNLSGSARGKFFPNDL